MQLQSTSLCLVLSNFYIAWNKATLMYVLSCSEEVVYCYYYILLTLQTGAGTGTCGQSNGAFGNSTVR